MSNILEIKNLTVSYGGIEAVKGIDMIVPEGQIVTLIGANGAGKSTTLKSISGLVKPKQRIQKSFRVVWGRPLRGDLAKDLCGKANFRGRNRIRIG